MAKAAATKAEQARRLMDEGEAEAPKPRKPIMMRSDLEKMKKTRKSLDGSDLELAEYEYEDARGNVCVNWGRFLIDNPQLGKPHSVYRVSVSGRPKGAGSLAPLDVKATDESHAKARFFKEYNVDSKRISNYKLNVRKVSDGEPDNPANSRKT